MRLRAVVQHVRAGWQRDAVLKDLGLGGACVLVAEPLVVGDKVTLSFVAPTLWDPLAIAGRVAWVGAATHLEPPRAGIAFSPREASAVLALFELMATLAYE